MKKIFTLIVAACAVLSVSAQNVKALEVTGTAAKTNNWDIQAFVNVNAENKLAAGTKYNIKFFAKCTSPIELTTETIDDAQSVHMDQWSNSAVYNYTESYTLTDKYAEYNITSLGVTDLKDCAVKEHDNTAADHKNFSYTPTAVLFGFGKLPVGAVLSICDIRVYTEAGELVTTVALNDCAEYDKSKSVYWPGWQAAATYAIKEVENPNAISVVKNDAEDAKAYNLSGVSVKEYNKGIIIRNGKKFINK